MSIDALILSKFDVLIEGMQQIQAQLSGPSNQYLTPDETADYAGVSVSTVHRWLRRRELKHVKHGRSIRIHRDELAKFLRKRTR